MPNEIRPCTLWGETFDACDVIEILSAERHIVVCVEGNQTFMSPPYDECVIQSQRYLQEAITAIYNALNAPVQATEEVLAGLPEEGEFLIQNVTWGFNFIDTDCIYILKNNRFIDSDLFNPSDDSVDVLEDRKENSFEIQAKNETALDYLRQFTLDGVRITKEKEASDD